MKKTILLLTLALIMFIPVAAQVDNQQLYQKKIQSFTRLKNAGWTMTGFGAGLAVTGTVLLATLPDSYWGYDEYDPYDEYDQDASDDVQAICGVLCVGVGIGLLAGGITMGSIGSHKVKSYRNKLNNLSMGMIVTPNRQGLTLTYRF